MSLSPSFVSNFQRESWGLYASGMLVICFRIGAQLWKLRTLRIDDFLMIFAACWYTLLCIALNRIVGGGGSNFMSEADIAALTPEITKNRIEGAKWVFVSEQSLMAVVWILKGCMLIVYARLTEGLVQRKYINWLTIYTYVGYGVTQISYFSMCRPFTDYFVVPPPPGQEQCASYLNVLIIQGCFNVTSDICMLLVGIPLLILVRVPLQQKVGIVMVFGMGIFVIIAAILCKVYSTLPSLLNDSINYTFWYLRETTVAVYVVNLPALWPVLRAFLPMLTGRGSSANTSRQNNSTVFTKTWPASRKRTQLNTVGLDDDDDFEMKGKRTQADADSEAESATHIGRSYYNSSQEHIIENGQGNGKGGFNKEVLEINRDVTFTVEHSRDGNSPPDRNNVTYERNKAGGYEANVQADNRYRGKDSM